MPSLKTFSRVKNCIAINSEHEQTTKHHLDINSERDIWVTSSLFGMEGGCNGKHLYILKSVQFSDSLLSKYCMENMSH